MTTLLRINFITVGNLRVPLDTSGLQNWRSELFSLSHAGHIGTVPDARGEDDWTYTDMQLQEIVRPDREAQLTIALVAGPLELNYYSRRLPGNLIVLSTFEISEVLQAAQIPMENFVLRAAYAHLVYYHFCGNVVPLTTKFTLSHQEIRGCLFDLNANKADLAVSASRPILCASCKANLQSRQVPPQFWTTLDRELARIKKPLYFRLADWVRQHPVLAFIATTLFALVVNVVSNGIYDLLKAWASGHAAQHALGSSLALQHFEVNRVRHDLRGSRPTDQRPSPSATRRA
jgi:hypothetical protein